MFEIVARSGSVRFFTPSPKNSTNLPTTLAWRSISVTLSTRSVAVTPCLSAPVTCTPTTSGVREIDRLAQHRRFRFDAADAPAHDAKPGDHAGVRIGADERVGIAHAVFFEKARREKLQVELVRTLLLVCC